MQMNIILLHIIANYRMPFDSLNGLILLQNFNSPLHSTWMVVDAHNFGG